MNNLDFVILWEDACRMFEENVLPYVQQQFEQDGEPDYCARSEEWNNWTDMLCKNGDISDWQYENWSQPSCCDR